MKPPALLALAFIGMVASVFAAEKKFTVTVEAGDFDRRGAIVSFALPNGVKGEELSLQREGKTFPVQVAKDGRAAFIPGDFKRGESVAFELITGRATYGATTLGQVLAQKTGSQLKLASANAMNREMPARPLLSYEAGPGTLPR